MKAEELMIGDWVIPLRKFARIPSRVVSIDEDLDTSWINSNGCEGLLLCNDLERIPITPEILEKNGFIKQETDTWAWEEKHIGNTDIMYQVPGVYFTKEYRDERGLHSAGWIHVTSEHGQISVEGENVHELQHALKLCGITKTIVV